MLIVAIAHNLQNEYRVMGMDTEKTAITGVKVETVVVGAFVFVEAVLALLLVAV